MPTIDQAARPLEIITPLGPNVLGLRSIHVHEQLSGGFTIEAELSSEDPDIKFDNIVGHPVGVRLKLPGGKERYWHALVARFMMSENAGHYFHYRAVLVPWLWALTRSADCRIFQNQTFPEIVKQVFEDRGAKDLQDRLTGTYPKVEYCAQYRETDFNFVSRLLEQEGIAYYFKHDKDKGQLVLADEKAAYDTAEDCEHLVYRPGEEGKQDEVSSWSIEHEVQPTQYALSDYNPLKPKEPLLRMAKVSRGYGMNDRQIFDYPGEYDTPGEAERMTSIRLDELQVSAEIVRAQTTCLGLGAGNLFKLKEHPRSEQNREYLVTSLSLSFDAGDFSSDGKGKPHSSCSFTAIPSSQAYRPPRTTPKPVVHGPQPALVVGPEGEEIYTDEHGRVKVSFYWDRKSKADEKSSCWLRIAQGWAGKKWGAFYLPRIGHEVLVEFIEGDPDDPIITGSVYNAENAPPYPLPAEKTKSTLKSLSSKGGGGFNEIRFEDKKDNEEIYLHAQKNMEVKVEEERTENIGKDAHLLIGKNFNEKVTEEHTSEIGKSSTVSIKENLHETIGKEMSFEVGGKFTLTLKDAAGVKIAKDCSIESDKHLCIAAKEIVIQAGDHITLQVGDNFIAIDKQGISICSKGTFDLKGTQGVEIKSEAKMDISAQAPLSIKGSATVAVEASAPLQLKGAIVQVN